MTTLTPNKKTDRLIPNYGECSSSVGDTGSPCSVSIVSDSDMIRNKRKSQKSTKVRSTRLNTEQNAFSTRHIVNRAEDIRKIRSVSSHTIIPPPFIINETNKRHTGMTRERKQVKNSARFRVIKRKTASHKIDDPICRESKQAVVSDINNGSCYFDNSLNSVEKTKTKFTSLIDFEKNGNIGAIYPQTSYSQNTFSLPSSETLNFNNVNLRHQKSHFDYLKGFDLIRYGGISEEITKSPEDKGIFSLVPKISPSERITLPRRKYNHVVLSVKDSIAVSQEMEENVEKDSHEIPMNIEFENADACSTEEAGDERRREDNKSLSDVWFLKDKNYVLVVKKPMRIRCIDEVSHKMKDVIIYSHEFLKGILKEKGISTTKKEIYETILKESTDYRGKSLRIITDVEKYRSSLRNSRKSQRDIESSDAKISNESSAKISKPVPQKKKNSSNIPPYRQSNQAFHTYNKTKKEIFVEEDVADISSKTFVIEAADASFTHIDGDSGRAKNESTKSIETLKRENTEFKYRNERKSRTALKRMDIESIIASSFSYYFHFYAKLGDHLKSGAVISKKNSTNWLKKCGIIYNNATKSMAEKRFMAAAWYVCIIILFSHSKNFLIILCINMDGFLN